MKKAILLTALMVSLMNVAQAQVGSSLFGFEGRVYLDGDKGKNVSITLYDNNKKVSSYETNRSGKFFLDIERNKHYTVVFKKEGFLAKRVIIKTHAKPNEVADVEAFKFDMNLEKKEFGVNYAQLDFPVTMIEFERLKGEFDYNKEYTENMIKIQEKYLEKQTNLAATQ